MKTKILLLVFSFYCLQIKAQYTVGIPVDDTLSYAGAGADTCYPNANISLIFPLSTVTGVDYVFEFNVSANDSIIANGITYYAGIHSVILNGVLTTYRPSDSATFGVIKAVGIPQIPNQPYPCGSFTIVSFGQSCPAGGDYFFIDTCYVLPASSIQNYSAFENPISIYPIISTGIFKIKSADKNLKQLRITDSAGRMVLSSANNFSEINLSNFSSGIYFYAITDEKENVWRGRIVKK